MATQTLAGLAPGATGTVTVTPLDTNGNPTTLPTGIVPTWTASNPAVSLTPAADGLSASATVAAGAAVDADSTITVAFPDGSVSTTAGFPIDPAAVVINPVASFGFVQS